MISGKTIGKVYLEIEKKICNMIPEKWDRIYLYVSILDSINKLETGEMFFYYYPKSVIKKNPINVYEVPGKFNLEEEMYLKLADSLYREIQRLKEVMIKSGEEPWTNLTISIENCQMKLEFDYEDLRKSPFTNIERNLIWQYKNLKKDINSYRRKERKLIEKYLEYELAHPKKTRQYIEPFYIKPEVNTIDYNTEYREKLKVLAAEEDEKRRLIEEKKKARKELALKKKKLLEKKAKLEKEKQRKEKLEKKEALELKKRKEAMRRSILEEPPKKKKTSSKVKVEAKVAVKAKSETPKRESSIIKALKENSKQPKIEAKAKKEVDKVKQLKTKKKKQSEV